jgi:hypothetical protein
MTFEEFAAIVQEWRTRLAPAPAARAVEALLRMRVVELPRGEVLEVALLLAMVLLAKKEAPPLTDERPLAITKSEDAAVLPCDSPHPGYPAPAGRPRWHVRNSPQPRKTAPRAAPATP